MDENIDNTQQENTQKRQPIRDLLVWNSPERPPLVLGKEEYTTAMVVCFLLSIILSFFREFFLIGFIWAAFLFVIALSKRPPEDVEHKITTQGIVSMKRTYLWKDMDAFWFTTRGKYPLLHIAMQGNMFGTLVMVVPNEGKPNKEDIRDTLAEYVPFVETPEKSRTDKLTDWMVQKLSLNRDSKTP